jgi:peroxiredoxin
LRSFLKADEAVDLYAISIDSPEKSKQVADKIAEDGKGKLNFPILADRDHRIIDAYGIRNPEFNGKEFEGQSFEGVPHPYVYVIDKDGRIAWVKVEKTVKERPTHEEIRAAFAPLK